MGHPIKESDGYSHSMSAFNCPQDLACQYNSIPTFPSRNRDLFLLKILSTELKMTYSLS